VAHGNGRFDMAGVRGRLEGLSQSRSTADFGITDDLALMGSFVAGPSSLARFAGDAPVNTDDRPTVVYGAPRITYAPDSLPRDRLIEFLHAVAIDPAELVTLPGDDAWNARLA